MSPLAVQVFIITWTSSSYLFYLFYLFSSCFSFLSREKWIALELQVMDDLLVEGQTLWSDLALLMTPILVGLVKA